MLPSLKLTAKAPENEWLEYFLVSFLGQKAYPLNELERFANTKQHRVVGLRSVLHGRRIAFVQHFIQVHPSGSVGYPIPQSMELGQITSSLPLFDHLRSNHPIPQQIPLAGQETHEWVLALNMGLPSIASFT